jgi:hypothetical protein
LGKENFFVCRPAARDRFLPARGTLFPAAGVHGFAAVTFCFAAEPFLFGAAQLCFAAERFLDGAVQLCFAAERFSDGAVQFRSAAERFSAGAVHLRSAAVDLCSAALRICSRPKRFYSAAVEISTARNENVSAPVVYTIAADPYRSGAVRSRSAPCADARTASRGSAVPSKCEGGRAVPGPERYPSEATGTAGRLRIGLSSPARVLPLGGPGGRAGALPGGDGPRSLLIDRCLCLFAHPRRQEVVCLDGRCGIIAETKARLRSPSMRQNPSLSGPRNASRRLSGLVGWRRACP